MFDPFWKLALGLFTGILFGVLLQKGRVAKYQVILGQFLLKDWTVVKIMGTAVVVGAIGIYALLPTEAVSLHLKPLDWGRIVTGGLLFGVGMAVLGYCPGTGVAACGEGRKDAMIGLVGMLTGAGLYVAAFPSIDNFLQRFGSAGKITLASVTGTSPWLWIGGLIALGLVGILMFGHERPKQVSAKRKRPHQVTG
ncbi:YeeE/YedE thiosulfate transporter family protein [Roseimaritima ulvae]|uniref:Putative inner membrane protein n=1 Tax=Roseimaritima ulvae TaxID=980254 RepID=A0A5B9QNY4_9BACT|nr:YeeE/YedE thiosulfate transporter family protein [Roseimaritima ulvae]QEG39370.1 putative inner membrane protein [Roseimaritima ulvae]